MNKLFFLFFMLSLLSLRVHSESVISVNALNYPAWIERDQESIALSPGDELEHGDQVMTGSSGRVWLSMADGSAIKLGQDANFKVEKAAIVQSNRESVMDAAFNVLKGAFRFTTSFFKSERQVPHSVNIQIGAITAGVRGTDIWGRSSEQEDFVALLEGQINVVADGGALPTRMDQPLTLYRKKSGQDADGITTIQEMLVNVLALETELSRADGIATVDGRYDLVLMSLADGANAPDNMQRFRQAGYAVQKQFATVNEQRYTRILLPGFVNIEAALNQAQQLSNEFELNDLWVSQRK